jgi:tetratricopeptide (TPR) repeat protein
MTNRRQQVWIRAVARALTLAIAFSDLMQGQTASDLLAQADRLAEQGNWTKARPIYASAEVEFRRLGDRRGELLAVIGRLPGDFQIGSYTTAREAAIRALDDPTVQNDPKSKIQALALLGTIDLNLNTAAAESDWKAVLEAATVAGDDRWQNRAAGELGLVAGVNGNTGGAAIALLKAITRAEQLGDIPTEIHFATWLANGMSVNGMADRALQLIERANELARRHGYADRTTFQGGWK